MAFRENAQLFTIHPNAVAEFNASNDLSIVYDAHRWHEDAQDAVDLVEPGSYVGIEKVSFSRQRLEAPFDDCLDTIPVGEMSKPHTPRFLERFVSNIAYSGLNLFELRQNNEARFTLYKERAFGELDSVGGIMGLNSFAGYYLKLCMELIEKDCVYAPAEADDTQLPTEVAESIRLSTDISSPLWNDMHHYRDRVLAHNLVNDSLGHYRQVLEIDENGQLPLTIVRGSGHRKSLNAILDDSSVEYRSTHIQRSLRPGQKEIIVPTAFSSPEPKKSSGRSVGRIGRWFKGRN